MFVPTQLAVQACGDISKQTLSLSYHRQAANFRSTALVLFIKENNIKPTMILYAVLYPFTPSVVSYARAQIGLHSLIPLTGEFQINKHKPWRSGNTQLGACMKRLSANPHGSQKVDYPFIVCLQIAQRTIVFLFQTWHKKNLQTSSCEQNIPEVESGMSVGGVILPPPGRMDAHGVARLGCTDLHSLGCQKGEKTHPLGRHLQTSLAFLLGVWFG